MVKADLQERHVVCKRGLTNDMLRSKLEHYLREEEEWQGMVMYRRDERFKTQGQDATYKDELHRTILDMLHMPMRMHEKVLNVLYGELLNGKTKNEVNATKVRCTTKRPVGAASLGVKVARLFENSEKLPEVFYGEVVYYRVEKKVGLYTVAYLDGDREDLNYDEYSDALKLAITMDADVKERKRAEAEVFQSILSPALVELTNCIRELGSLGQTWTHQWDANKSKQLQPIKLPLDQSKRIFCPPQLEGLLKAVDIAIPAGEATKRRLWKAFLTSYVAAMDILTSSIDYTPQTIESLEKEIDTCYALWMNIAGMKGVTNYFHYFGSGHVMWLIGIYGNLWRWRNEGVESANSILSLRYNKFNNKGGHKGCKQGDKVKCDQFEVLGAWMGRVSMWVMGLADRLFQQDLTQDVNFKTILWKTGSRIVYDDVVQEEDVPEWLPENEVFTVSDGDDDIFDVDIDCSDEEDDAYICAQSFMLSHADVPVATDNHPIVDRQSRRLRYDS